MATEISKTPIDLSIFQPFSEFLKDIWKNDDKRLESAAGKNSSRTFGIVVTLWTVQNDA